MRLLDYNKIPMLIIAAITLCFWASSRYQPRLVALSATPDVSRESIETAIAAYQIKKPLTCKIDTIDHTRSDIRGVTERTAWWQPASITLTPAAFVSWGVLGSTLAHEIEVHCNQAFAVIHILNLISPELGTALAEISAYQHEINHQQRFGLSEREVEDVKLSQDPYLSKAPRWLVRIFG